ncbi:MAG TPA: YtxH domain-containing protein [Gemmatimonadota bacterium]|nr:YtxH domain-containing protein [Gemmatimonadota bacterium]
MIGRIKAFAAGFLIGILVAPRSGSASRRLLMDRFAEFLDGGRREYEELEEDLAARRSNGPLTENDWPEVDESMIGGPDTRSGA